MASDELNQLNSAYYDNSGARFDKVPFPEILPSLLESLNLGPRILEIGSGPGALALWLKERGHDVLCLEPAQKLADVAAERGLSVVRETIQEFETDEVYDDVIAISSLIHVRKQDLPKEIEKIARFMKPRGHFIVCFIEGEGEIIEDPTDSGKPRFFAKWSQSEIDVLLSPYFEKIENHRIANEKRNRVYLLSAFRLKKR